MGQLKRLHWKRAWEAINGPFLMALGLGIIMAIFTLAAPCIGCLPMSPYHVLSFFMGLVVASIPLMGKHIQNGVRIPGCGPCWWCAAAWWLTSLPPLVQTDHPMFLVLRRDDRHLRDAASRHFGELCSSDFRRVCPSVARLEQMLHQFSHRLAWGHCSDCLHLVGH